MPDKQIKLLASDSTVWGKCPLCCRTGRGVIAGNHFAKAYTKVEWAKNPTCDNCKGALDFMYEVK